MADTTNILVVSKGEISGNYLSQLLRNIGYQVYQSNGFSKKEIFDKIESANIDVVLLDLQVAEIRLLEMVREIKKKYLCIVMATLPFDAGILKKAAITGVDEVFIKPIDLHQLKISIEIATGVKIFYNARRNLLKRYEETEVKDKEEIKRLSKQIEEHRKEIDRLNIENDQKGERIRKLYAENEKLTLETIQIIYKLSEYRDYETYEHTARVGWLSKKLAEVLGLDKGFVQAIELAAPLHDLGKIGIPDSILMKPGKLEYYEFEEMKKHTIYGYELLKDSSTYVLRLAAEIALTHHERWNGSGYPKGLERDNIPISAQIVGVADSFDAMVTDRPYKRAKSLKEAFKEIKENSGILYSPKVVEAFLKLEKEITIIYSEERPWKHRRSKNFCFFIEKFWR